MLDILFYTVLNMSITATAIGVILLIVKLFMKVIRYFFKISIPRKAIYALWVIVLIRLMLPFSFSSKLSVFNFFKAQIKKVVSVPVSIIQHDMELSASNCIGAAKQYFPLEYKTEYLDTIFTVGAIIWVAGVIVIGVFALIMYYATSKRLNKSVLIKQVDFLEDFPTLKNNSHLKLYASDVVTSPMIFGFIKPRIIIPMKLVELIKNNSNSRKDDSLSKKEASQLHNLYRSLGYAIVHELVHIKSKDNIWKVLSSLVVILHWFNPFIWWFKSIADRDMELACDEGVISILSEKQRKEYASALVELSAKRQHILSIAFGEKVVKLRIVNILNYKSITRITLITAIIIFIALFAILITNP